MKGESVRGNHSGGGSSPDIPVKLVAFLGNPGQRYQLTRHNVAWMVVPELTSADESAWKEKFHGRFLKEGTLTLLKPETYMNHSGRSIQAARAFFGLEPAEIVVVHDDVETAFGTVELSWDGGHRGQNGVRSAIQALGTGSFWRVRIGVGRPPSTRKPADWVLERFSPQEEAELPAILANTARIVRDAAIRPSVRSLHI
ncbi:MAG: aminoacyl-tRNA hydrolase [Alkalispirochaeta sp.]